MHKDKIVLQRHCAIWKVVTHTVSSQGHCESVSRAVVEDTGGHHQPPARGSIIPLFNPLVTFLLQKCPKFKPPCLTKIQILTNLSL